MLSDIGEWVKDGGISAPAWTYFTVITLAIFENLRRTRKVQKETSEHSTTTTENVVQSLDNIQTSLDALSHQLDKVEYRVTRTEGFIFDKLTRRHIKW